MQRLVGIHAVAAALRTVAESGKGLDHVIVVRGAGNSRLQSIVDECRRLGVPLRFEPRSALQRIASTASHQGVVAIASSGSYRSLEEVLEVVEDIGTIVMLDSVQDPRNLGAIIRSADAAGASAVAIPERRSARLSEAATKAAAGALESIPVARVKNLGRAMDQVKEAGFWIYGFAADAAADYDTVKYADRCALVLGGESDGLRRSVAERCDFLVRIPLEGSVLSLNVSVAAAVALFEVRRQRRTVDRITS